MNQSKKILVVEDEPDLQEILKHLLGDAGYAVQCAGNGGEGLRLYDEFIPDLVLLDVHLPDMSGFEICREIRTHRKNPKTPIVLCTVRSEVSPVAEGLNSGADDYILKPFEVDNFLERVREVLERNKNRRDS
jgi:DNA-binding response OmpR family regulator